MLAVNGASDVEQAKAESSIGDAERRIRTLLGALETTNAKIVETEVEIAALADAEQRRKTAAEIELIINDLSSIEQRIVADAAVLVEVASRAEPATLDAAGLRLLGHRLQTEFSDAAKVVISGLRAHSVAVIGGHAPAVIGKPEVPAAPVVKLEPKTRVFATSPLMWLDEGGPNRKTCARNVQVELPAALASKAVRLGYALELTDERWKRLSVGFVAPPAPGPHCVNLDTPDLRPARALFGADQLKRNAEFRETRGGNQSWVRAERG